MFRSNLGAALVATGLALSVYAGATPVNAAPPLVVKIKTDWGYISVPIVKAPKPGKCVGVSPKIDVRNAALVPIGGFNMGITDDFGNLIAYSEWSNFVAVNGKIDITQKKPNGVYTEPMTACAMPATWTDPYRVGVTVPLIAAKAKGSYTFVAITSFERISEGEVEYSWKK